MTLFDRLFAGNKSYFEIPISEQKGYLNQLGNAKDDYERSFKQYQGQMFYMTWKKRLLLSAFSVLPVLFLFIYYIINGFFLKSRGNVDAISRANEKKQFIPSTLMDRYVIERELWNSKGAVYIKDVPFISAFLIRNIIHPYYSLKVLFKIAKYSALIFQYNPKAIIVNDEFSFTSSVLTLFCERHHVKHIDVQHGEKLFFLRDSFFRFHECYIWDEHYKDLFISLKAEPSQFIIELPESMKFVVSSHYSQENYADFKYYLGIYTEEELKGIINAMSPIKRKGYTIKYRPHPNYSDRELLKKYVEETEIESSEVNILESISSTKNVVGVYSTVLTQAYFNGQKVIIDDISYKNQYGALKDLNYILIDKVENRLSMYQSA